jgi:DNA-directed RNA polymerase specialized sigma24 family protein
VQDAFVIALERWPGDGVPSNPGAWITTAARDRALDRVRREGKRDAKHRAAQLTVKIPAPEEARSRPQSETRIPAIAPAVKGREFRLTDNKKYLQHMEKHPDAVKSVGLPPDQARAALNYVNGKRSVAQIASYVAGDLDQQVSPQAVAAYLELLGSAGWLVFK